MSRATLEQRVAALEQKVDALLADRSTIYSQPDNRMRFSALVQEWRRTRGHSSKIKDLIDNSAYRQIIGMGPPAIPLILEELERQPGHWSPALRAISGEDPIPHSARGRLEQEAAIWLEWGREKKFR